MTQETSPLEHLLSFIPPHMHRMAQMIYNLAYSHAVKVTEQAHDILDEPEFVLTDLLKIPIPLHEPMLEAEGETLKLLAYHHDQYCKIAAKLKPKTLKDAKRYPVYDLPRDERKSLVLRNNSLNCSYGSNG